MDNNLHLVVMAGGIGSRFWPMSTAERPKQFIDVLGCGRTLLQLTIDRFKGVCPEDNIWVVTSSAYAQTVHEQLPDLPLSHILQEPCRRNTAPCIAYVSWRIKMENARANIVVAPSDHIVLDIQEFRRVVTSALRFTAETDSIVTLGMKPSRPETGYGYIQADLSTPCARNREIYRVDSFREKPDFETAKRYISHSNYFWNSGIFIFRVSTIVNALRIYAPEISEVFESIQDVYGTAREQATIDARFPECPGISIDYAVMEKAEEIYVFPADFGWSDLGTWGSLHERMAADSKGNVSIGTDIELYECHDCIVHTTDERRVVLQGLDGFIVAEKDNALLVCRRSEEQRLRQFIDKT
ncbi:MAG: mannose-1-phosphate guanylyltransferase [Bacteroidaceae bacterium]|nr:mannose-1-phosphate guanylyltransferase [Bacteroidaceae bacterium]